MTRHPVLPRPFQEPKSFTAVACGTERITIKPEWAPSFPEASGLQSDKEKPEQTQTKEARNG